MVTQWISRYGAPVQIHTDQGSDFESHLYQEVCKLLGVTKTRTSAYRPQSDGLVERFNRTMKQMLKSFIEEQPEDWDDYLPYLLMAYRATIQESTKCSPNLLMFGHEISLPVDVMYGNPESNVLKVDCHIEYVEWLKETMTSAFEGARESLKKSAVRQKNLYDKNAQEREFKAGDWVWVYHPQKNKEKFGRGWLGPFLIVKKVGPVNYQVQQSPNSRLRVIHVDYVKEYNGETPDNWLPV